LATKEQGKLPYYSKTLKNILPLVIRQGLFFAKFRQNLLMQPCNNKSTKQVLAENQDYKTLINAVIRQLGGKESLSDIREHGIAGGYCGFTYYSDTCKRFDPNNLLQTFLQLLLLRTMPLN